MRSARLIVVGLTAAAALALAVVAVAQRTSLSFTLGVARAAPVARLGPGEQACQRPIDVPAGGAFDRVALGVAGRAALRLTVRDARGGLLATGNVAASGSPGRARRGPPGRPVPAAYGVPGFAADPRPGRPRRRGGPGP